jgi:hypothetical protein
MKLLTDGIAQAYYNNILDVHFNRGAQSIGMKIVEYKDILDKVMDNVHWVNPKTGDTENGYGFLRHERRNIAHPAGAVAQMLVSGIDFLRSARNDISHYRIQISQEDYLFCVRHLAEVIEFLSEVPVIAEVKDIYKAHTFIGQWKPSRRWDSAGLQYRNTPAGIIITDYDGAETSLTVPDKIEEREVVEIGVRAFAETNIRDIALPASVSVIRDNAFEGCVDLTRVFFPDHLERIEKYAFYGCGLRVASFPAGLSSIGVGAFQATPLAAAALSHGAAFRAEKSTAMLNAFPYTVSFTYID